MAYNKNPNTPTPVPVPVPVPYLLSSPPFFFAAPAGRPLGLSRSAAQHAALPCGLAGLCSLQRQRVAAASQPLLLVLCSHHCVCGAVPRRRPGLQPPTVEQECATVSESVGAVRFCWRRRCAGAQRLYSGFHHRLVIVGGRGCLRCACQPSGAMWRFMPCLLCLST